MTQKRSFPQALTGLCLGLAFMLSACSQADQSNTIIEAHVAAFNASDFEAMQALQHPDIEWFGIDGDVLTPEISGQEALMAMLRDYRSSNPTVSGHLRGWNQTGNFASVIETAKWTDSDGHPRQQSALSVYEFDEGLIRRVWYFPAVRETE